METQRETSDTGSTGGWRAVHIDAEKAAKQGIPSSPGPPFIGPKPPANPIVSTILACNPPLRHKPDAHPPAGPPPTPAPTLFELQVGKLESWVRKLESCKSESTTWSSSCRFCKIVPKCWQVVSQNHPKSTDCPALCTSPRLPQTPACRSEAGELVVPKHHLEQQLGRRVVTLPFPPPPKPTTTPWDYLTNHPERTACSALCTCPSPLCADRKLESWGWPRGTWSSSWAAGWWLSPLHHHHCQHLGTILQNHPKPTACPALCTSPPPPAPSRKAPPVGQKQKSWGWPRGTWSSSWAAGWWACWATARVPRMCCCMQAAMQTRCGHARCRHLLYATSFCTPSSSEL
jgi:hypothetical protein